MTRAWAGSMTAPFSSVVSGSNADRSLPRRSHPVNEALCSHAPDRSQRSSRASSKRAPVRSASRIRTPWNTLRRRSAPGRPMNDQSPPSTSSRPNVQPSNMLPTSLQPANEASKNEHRVKVQLTKAALACLETLKRAPRKAHSVKTPPSSTVSLRSTSMKATFSWRSPDRSRPSQSAERTVDVVAGAAIPCFLSATWPTSDRLGRSIATGADGAALGRRVGRLPAEGRRHLGRDELQRADGGVVVGHGRVELGDQVGGDRQHPLLPERGDDLVGVAVERVEPAQRLLLAEAGRERPAERETLGGGVHVGADLGERGPPVLGREHEPGQPDP